jgi:hypothetical protein
MNRFKLCCTAIVFVLTLTGCAGGNMWGDVTNTATVSASPSSTASPSPSAAATPSERDKITAEAQQWVRQMVVNFEGVDTVPAECVDAQFIGDLATPGFYWDRKDKESKGAFGSSIGSAACEISKNRVERYFRDPSLSLQKAREIGLDKTDPSQVAAKVVVLNNGPFQDRLDLARKVLGWYADPKRKMRIVQKDGAYTSAFMKADGTTDASHGNKPSTVIETVDRATDEVIKGDRVNCGDQPYVPGIPAGYEVPPPGQERAPKRVSDHPVTKGDAGGTGTWAPAAPVTTDATSPKGGTPPKVYKPSPSPSASPTPRVSLTPKVEPSAPTPAKPEPSPTVDPCTVNSDFCE